MKKTRIVFPVLLLVCAGMVMMGCAPSDPDEKKKIDEPDMVFEGGKHQHLFDDPLIEHDKEYEVIFTIEDCDGDFIGSRLGGKICYKMDLNDPDDKVLSGWANAVPPVVAADIYTYKWTFRAGAANSDNVTIENPATTPAGGKQYFSFTAQDSSYHDYGSNITFNVKGEFKVNSKETVAVWESAGTVTLGNDGGTAGKGALTEADMERVRALPARSKIVFTVSVNVVLDGDTRPGWGVCSVGGWENNNSLQISVPAGTPAGQQTFTAEFEIANLLALQSAGYQIAVNPYNGATVTKAELFKPKT